MLNEQQYKTIVDIKKNAEKQVENLKIEQIRQKKENERQIALINEQHNITINKLEKNAREQAENFKINK